MKFLNIGFIVLVISNISQAQNVNLTKADTYQRHTELAWNTDVSGAEYFKVMRSDDKLSLIHISEPTRPY